MVELTLHACINSDTDDKEVIEILKNFDILKMVEQEPKTGHWIDTDEGFSPCECSECESVEFIKSKFCPNCGARMFESQEREGESDCRDCKVEHDCYVCEKYEESEERNDVQNKNEER